MERYCGDVCVFCVNLKEAFTSNLKRVNIMQNITIFDTEHWADEGSLQNGWGRLEDHIPHVIQIAAIRIAVQEGFPEVGRLNILVKPRNFKGEMLPVTKYFTNLTHISEKDVLEKGLELNEAMQQFFDFAGGEDGVIYSYGSDMNTSLLPSCLEQNVNVRFKRAQVGNIRLNFELMGLPKEIIAANSSGQLANALDLPVPNTHHIHDALNDTHSLVTVLRHLAQNKPWDEVEKALAYI